jgi:hypothetical protein
MLSRFFARFRETKWYILVAAFFFACSGGGLLYSQGYIIPRGAVFWAGLVGLGQYGPDGVIYTNTAPVYTIGTTNEQTLASFSLPANSLDQAGRRLRITATFLKANNNNTITGKIYWAGTSVSSGSVTGSNNNLEMQLEVVESGTQNEQIIWSRGSWGTTVINPAVTTVAGVQTQNQTIAASCTQGTSNVNDCILQDFKIEFMD